MGAGLILENEVNLEVEVLLHFKFSPPTIKMNMK